MTRRSGCSLTNTKQSHSFQTFESPASLDRGTANPELATQRLLRPLRVRKAELMATAGRDK